MAGANHIAAALAAVTTCLSVAGCAPADADPAAGYSPAPADADPAAGRRPDAPLLRMHQEAARIFGSQAGFGRVRVYTNDVVTPFKAGQVGVDSWIKVHAVYPQTLRAQLYSYPYDMKTLNLIGAVRHQPPRAYDTITFQQRDDLTDVPTRELTDFERSALDRIEAGQPAWMRETGDAIEMVGPIRAGVSCARCHHVEEGRLLGAFKYVVTAKRGA